MKCKDLVKVKNIVCFDPFNEEQEEFFKERGTFNTIKVPLSFFSQKLLKLARKIPSTSTTRSTKLILKTVSLFPTPLEPLALPKEP